MQSAVTRLADLGCGTFGNVWLGHNATFGKLAVKTVKVRPLSLVQLLSLQLVVFLHGIYALVHPVLESPVVCLLCCLVSCDLCRISSTPSIVACVSAASR